ncbi:MAG TPA: hypothetical protein VFG69_04500 [Nannocystaceae bacterium]|nr:hypothetical protein [Nannocystaceae bacterium]
MLACHDCRRFVREESTACPFCGAALVAVRAPLGGFLGVLLGITLVACSGDGDDDEGTASGTLTIGNDDGATSGNDTTIGNDTSSVTEVSGPLYGPVTFDTSGDETAGGSDDSSGDTGGESDSTGTDTGDATTGGSESAGPLYGPATSN